MGVCPEHMQHNTNLFADPCYLVVPMLRFFSLPDYSFDEVELPAWAYLREPQRGEQLAALPRSILVAEESGDDSGSTEYTSNSEFSDPLVDGGARPSGRHPGR